METFQHIQTKHNNNMNYHGPITQFNNYQQTTFLFHLFPHPFLHLFIYCSQCSKGKILHTLKAHRSWLYNLGKWIHPFHDIEYFHQPRKFCQVLPKSVSYSWAADILIHLHIHCASFYNFV